MAVEHEETKSWDELVEQAEWGERLQEAMGLLKGLSKSERDDFVANVVELLHQGGLEGEGFPPGTTQVLILLVEDFSKGLS